MRHIRGATPELVSERAWVTYGIRWAPAPFRAFGQSFLGWVASELSVRDGDTVTRGGHDHHDHRQRDQHDDPDEHLECCRDVDEERR
jgi:hypothetical protein